VTSNVPSSPRRTDLPLLRLHLLFPSLLLELMSAHSSQRKSAHFSVFSPSQEMLLSDLIQTQKLTSASCILFIPLEFIYVFRLPWSRAVVIRPLTYTLLFLCFHSVSSSSPSLRLPLATKEAKPPCIFPLEPFPFSLFISRIRQNVTIELAQCPAFQDGCLPFLASSAT